MTWRGERLSRPTGPRTGVSADTPRDWAGGPKSRRFEERRRTRGPAFRGGRRRDGGPRPGAQSLGEERRGAAPRRRPRRSPSPVNEGCLKRQRPQQQQLRRRPCRSPTLILRGVMARKPSSPVNEGCLMRWPRHPLIYITGGRLLAGGHCCFYEKIKNEIKQN